MVDTNESIEIDDLSSSVVDAQDELFSVPASESMGPDLDVTASSSITSSPFSASAPFNSTNSFPMSEAMEEIEERIEEHERLNKKKKSRKEKSSRSSKSKKAPRESREQEETALVVDKAAANAVRVLGILLLVFIVLANIAAFIVAGFGCILFLILFDLLGLIALLVPFFLLGGLRKQPLSLFDAFLAFAAVFSVVACMVLLAQQAKTYGSKFKAALNAPAVVETLDC